MATLRSRRLSQYPSGASGKLLQGHTLIEIAKVDLDGSGLAMMDHGARKIG